MYTYIYIYIYTHVYTSIYIYIYIYSIQVAFSPMVFVRGGPSAATELLGAKKCGEVSIILYNKDIEVVYPG